MAGLPNPIRPSEIIHGIRRFLGNDQLVLSVLALVVGLGVGGGVIGLREAIDWATEIAWGARADGLVAAVKAMPWFGVALTPAAGGLLVALFYRWLMPGQRPEGVAHVIEASTFNRAHMPLGRGLGAAVGSALSLGVGASVGREGPAVHLGATLAAQAAQRLHLPRNTARAILGCGVAAAVAASFNAPIAGALFAHEVVIGHFALAAFAPVVIASVAATMVTRAWFGPFPAFSIPDYPDPALWEYPLFIVVGLGCGLIALGLMRGIFAVEDGFARARVPFFWRAPIAGFAIGLMALALPEVLGVGYEATDSALKADYVWYVVLGLAVAKLVATMLSLGGGFGGGIFSPALAIGALLGAAFGAGVAEVVPGYDQTGGTYAMAGMGAMAAAVLNAPISTILIVFELTGDYGLTVAAMVAVVTASVLAHQIGGPGSFFTAQLDRRGIKVDGGMEKELLRTMTVRQVMRTDCAMVAADTRLPRLRQALQDEPAGVVFVAERTGRLYGALTLADLGPCAFDPRLDDLIVARDVARPDVPRLHTEDSLSTALRVMEGRGFEHVAVIEGGDAPRLIGCIHESEALVAFNAALARARADEEGRAHDDAAGPF